MNYKNLKYNKRKISLNKSFHKVKFMMKLKKKNYKLKKRKKKFKNKLNQYIKIRDRKYFIVLKCRPHLNAHWKILKLEVLNIIKNKC